MWVHGCPCVHDQTFYLAASSLDNPPRTPSSSPYQKQVLTLQMFDLFLVDLFQFFVNAF